MNRIIGNLAYLLLPLIILGMYFYMIENPFYIVFFLAGLLLIVIQVAYSSRNYRLPREFIKSWDTKDMKRVVFTDRKTLFSYLDRIKSELREARIHYYRTRFPKEDEEITLFNGKKSKWPYSEFRPVATGGPYAAYLVFGHDAFILLEDKKQTTREDCNYIEVYFGDRVAAILYLRRFRIYLRNIESWGYLYKNVPDRVFSQLAEISKEFYWSRWTRRVLWPFLLIVIMAVILFIYFIILNQGR